MLGRLLAHHDLAAIKQFAEKNRPRRVEALAQALQRALYPARTSLVRTLEGHTYGVNGVALSGDGRRAVSASSDETLKVWDVETGEVAATFTCDGDAYCCAFIDDDRIIAGGASGHVHFLRLEEPKS